MDKLQLINEISKKYNIARLGNEDLIKLERMVKNGTATFEQASKAAETAGKIIANEIYLHYNSFGSGGEIAIEDGTELFASLLKENHDYITSLSESIQKNLYELENIGLNPVHADFDAKDAKEIADKAADGISKEELKTRCGTASRKSVDQTIRANAEAQQRVGFEVRVSRMYDGIGLSGGRECKWCLERCGKDMPYSEAYEKGVFERHNGCGCIITYTSKRGKITFQTEKGGWYDAPNSDTIERRRTAGLSKAFQAEPRLGRIKEFLSADSKELLEKAKNGGTNDGIFMQAVGKTKPQLEKSIKTHLKAVNDHTEKLKNPAKYMTRDDPKDPIARQRAINDWTNHRRRNAEQAAIELEVWRERFE